MPIPNSFKTRTDLKVDRTHDLDISVCRLLQQSGFSQIARLPYSLKILLENLLRNEDGRFVKAADIKALASWDVKSTAQREISFMPRARAAAGLYRSSVRRRSGRDEGRHRRGSAAIPTA